MLVALPDLLSPDDATGMVQLLQTAGHAGAPAAQPVPNGVQFALTTALGRHPVFDTVAAPRRIGDAAALAVQPGGRHDYPDNEIVAAAATDSPLRVDIMITVFLSAPESYGGGELAVLTDAGPQQIKLPAGGAVLYPASARRRVNEVTHGVRWALDIPVQSMIREEERRDILAEIWSVMDWLDHMPADARPRSDPALSALRRARADLLRMWVDL